MYLDYFMVTQRSVAGIILAAGASTRFGRPKQLLRLNGKYLLEWVLDATLNSNLNRIVLVLGAAHQQIVEALGQKLRHPKLSVEINPEFLIGQSSSLRIGLSKVLNDFAAVMFLLADQPLLNSTIINSLLNNFWHDGKDIGIPTCRGKRKNPAIFSRRFYRQLMDISGDTGARQLIEKNPADVSSVEIANPMYFWDIDTEQDVERLEKQLKKVK